jgi:hypothetical protein
MRDGTPGPGPTPLLVDEPTARMMLGDLSAKTMFNYPRAARTSQAWLVWWRMYEPVRRAAIERRIRTGLR